MEWCVKKCFLIKYYHRFLSRFAFIASPVSRAHIELHFWKKSRCSCSRWMMEEGTSSDMAWGASGIVFCKKLRIENDSRNASSKIGKKSRRNTLRHNLRENILSKCSFLDTVESESQPFEYQKHLTTNFLKFGFQMVWYSNGWSKAKCYVVNQPCKYQTRT